MYLIVKKSAREMALDTLNSNAIGGKRKTMAENIAAAGLEKPPRKYY